MIPTLNGECGRPLRGAIQIVVIGATGTRINHVHKKYLFSFVIFTCKF